MTDIKINDSLSSLAEVITENGLNFCGATFENIDSGTEFTILVSKTNYIEQLKADKAGLLKALNGVMNIVAVSTGVNGYHCNGDVACWWDFDEIGEVSDLIQKHKTQNTIT